MATFGKEGESIVLNFQMGGGQNNGGLMCNIWWIWPAITKLRNLFLWIGYLIQGLGSHQIERAALLKWPDRKPSEVLEKLIKMTEGTTSFEGECLTDHGLEDASN